MFCGWTESCTYPPTGNTHKGGTFYQKWKWTQILTFEGCSRSILMESHRDFLKKHRSISTTADVAHILHVDSEFVLEKSQDQFQQLKQIFKIWKTFPPSADKYVESSGKALLILNMKTNNNQEDHPGLTFWFRSNPCDWLPLFPVTRHCRMIYRKWQLSESVFWW